MKTAPFIYGVTVSNDAFTDRESESEKLKSNLTGGINTMIISPRRWGKSSLVEKVIIDINQNNDTFKTVIMDLFTTGSKEEFLEVFAQKVIKASSSKWEDWMNSGKNFFKSLLPKLSVGASPDTDFSISFDWKELDKHSDEVLNLPETIAQKKGYRYIICIDEFQNLAAIKGFPDFEKKMRAVWQRQKSVTYCLYGSKRHMMTEIFNRPSKPFYRFGDIVFLHKIERPKWVAFIYQRFFATNKHITNENAEKIAALMKDTPWYVQQLAHYTWRLTWKTAGVNEINAALNELIYANAPLYQKEIETISTTQLNLLKAVARGETQFTSTAVMQQYVLGTPRNVSKNKTILINNDIIHAVNELYEFIDPAFELWFNKQFFNKSYLL